MVDTRPERTGPALTGASVGATLSLSRAEGAFAALEAFLDAEGFWRRRGVVADVFLGYGLSAALQRGASRVPPEPCPLPLLCCRIRAERGGLRPAAAFALGAWERSWDDASYAAAIERVRAAIGRGDVYQVNLVQHLRAPFSGDATALAAALAPLRPRTPRPFVGDGFTLVSASPELFLARRGDTITTAPIKGTRPAGVTIADAKDLAEHVMIVDLERNDLARVCVPGSIRWPQFRQERELAGVTHLESTIHGQLRADATLSSILEATFPGGSVTGAPKLAAIELIAELEPVGRGASMGALGVVRPDGDFEFALTIRTFAVSDGSIHLWVGGGIVWDSDPRGEIEESWVKARPLLDALAASSRSHARPVRVV